MIEVELPDGTIVEFPAGTSQEVMRSALAALTKPSPQKAMVDRIAAAKAGTLTVSPESAARASAADQIAQDQMTISDAGPLASGVTKFVQGIPAVGEYSDELTGVVGRAVLGEEGGNRAMESQRAVMSAMDRQYPKTSMGLQAAGGIAAGARLSAFKAPRR